MTDNKPKMPTHRLRIVTKKGVEPRRTGTVGAAWQQEDGSFFIQLEAGVVLNWQDPVTLRLFPVADEDAPF
jgi:hypothetical protein